MSLFSPPTPPDPQAGIAAGQQVAAGQQQYNTQAGIMSQAGSNVNQYNPYGSLTYSQTGTGPGGVPMWTSNLQLTPQQQALFDTLQGTKATAGTDASKLLAGANYGATDPSKVIGDATSGNTAALMSMWQQANQPALTTAKSQLDTSLRNQGLAPGNPAYDNAMRALDTNQTNAVTGASAQFEPQAYSQALQNYGLPAALATQLAALGAPGDPKSELTNPAPLSIQPANLTGAVSTENQANQAQYAAQNAQYANMMSGLMGVPTALLGGWAKSGGLQGLGSGLGSLFGGGAGAAGAAAAGDAAGAGALAGLGDAAAMMMI